MSVDWTSFGQHQQALEIRRLHIERDALAQALEGAVKLIEMFKPMLKLAGDPGGELTMSLEMTVARAREMIYEATKVRKVLAAAIES